MMKKMVSMAMAAVMAATLMVAAVPAEVNAAENAGSTELSYTKNVDNPDNPDVYISIPDSITFTDTNKEIDANVELVDVNGNIITAYEGTAKFSVTSTNGFKLASNGNVLPYTLTYGSFALDSVNTENPLTAQEIGTIGMVGESDPKTLDATLEGKAKLTGTATVAGTYTDTLNYTVEFN